jgi:hypothetical protein
LIQSKARILGFDRVTGLAGSISILKKIQNGIVLVKQKNKSQRIATGFCWVNRVAGSAESHQVMTFPIFFINSTRFQPRINLPRQAGF